MKNSSAILSLLAATIFLLQAGCSSNPSVVLWKHGFTKELENNPIFLSDKMIVHEGTVVGIATNKKGKKFWFRGAFSDRKVEVFPLATKDGNDETEKVEQLMNEMHASGGEYIEWIFDDLLVYMEQMDWVWERTEGTSGRTGSYLGYGSANLSETDAEQLEHLPAGEIRRAR